MLGYAQPTAPNVLHMNATLPEDQGDLKRLDFDELPVIGLDFQASASVNAPCPLQIWKIA